MSDYAITIRDMAQTLLQAKMGVAFKTYRKTPMLMVDPSDLPTLGVFIMRERRRADGDENAGEPRFIHELTLGFSGAENLETDKVGALATLEETMSLVDDALLTDPRFVNLTEGVLSMDRQSQYSKVGETSLAEIRVEMVLKFRTRYPPVIPDDLETIHVESRYPKSDVDPAEVQQIVREYDIEQN